MLKELLRLAPDLIPIIVTTVLDVESVVTGVKMGSIKKNKVLQIIQNVLTTKSYFTDNDTDGQNMIVNLVSQFIDALVSAMNLLGVFSTSEKLDFTPIPITPDTEEDGDE